MANEQNLKPFNTLTEKEQRKIQIAGGKASGKARQQKKTFCDLFNSFLERQVTNDQLKAQLRQFGFTDEECTNKNAMVFAQYREALKGSTQAFVAVRDTTGEKPVDQVQNINPPIITIERPKE